jgi:hypothetical protein
LRELAASRAIENHPYLEIVAEVLEVVFTPRGHKKTVARLE